MWATGGALIYLSVATAALMTAVSGKTTPATPFPSSVSTDPHSRCSAGEKWSQAAQRCCPICGPGTGATGACATVVFSASSSSDPPSGGSIADDAVKKINNDGGVEGVSNNDNGTLNSKNNNFVNSGQCEACVDGLTYSSTYSIDQPCLPCPSDAASGVGASVGASAGAGAGATATAGSGSDATPPSDLVCPKHARAVSTCNATHGVTVSCECEPGVFYLSQRSGQCELCVLCPAGWGVDVTCGLSVNTGCRPCLNGTYSDALSATAPCRRCTVCTEGQRMLQECTANQDTVCFGKYKDIPPMYRFNSDTGSHSNGHDLDLARGHLNGDSGRRHKNNRPAVQDDDGGIDVIPLYCAALGAVVVGLVGYVGFVHYRRMRDKRMSREPHEDVEYSKASGADSGVFSDLDHHHHQNNHQQKYQTAVVTGSTRLRDISQAKRKELEKTLLAGSRGPADWKALARELGYNSGKISSFEPRGSSRDPGAPYRHVLHDWSRLEGATMAALMRALRNTGRHDVVKFVQAECAEQSQPLATTLPPHIV